MKQAIWSPEPMPLHPCSDRITREHLYVWHDEPDPEAGNGTHNYAIRGMKFGELLGTIKYQHGPLGEEGVTLNGISSGTLLQIELHHLKSFQAGPFSSRENAIVITKLEECLMWLKSRELDRQFRGVLGKNKE